MNIQKSFYKMQFSTVMRLKLYRKISSFIKQGSPLFDMLLKLESKYEASKKGDIRAAVIRYWIKDMNDGKDFSEAIAYWVPPAERMLIAAGEKSGAMEDAINNAIDVTEASKNMKSAIIGALSYPGILIMILFGMIYLFSTQVVPKLVSIKDPETWPGPAKTMYEMSVFVESYWTLMIVGIIAVFAAINYSIPRLTGPIRDKLDAIPPWSIYNSFESSVFLISIASLMKTGTALMDALEELRMSASPYTYSHITRMIRRMEAGKNNGVSLNAGFLPKEVGMDIEIYDETADFQGAMEQVGRESIEDGIATIQSSAKSMGSLVMMGVGFYIGWVYYSFFTLTSSIAT
jgi:type II secretory pathway component PulF